MKQFVYTLPLAGAVLLTACSNFPSGTKTARATPEPRIFQPKETMLEEARAYKKLRQRVEQKSEEFSRAISAHKARVRSLAGREKYEAHVSITKRLRNQSLAFQREMIEIQPFCTIMGPCPTYLREREKLDESVKSFDSLQKRLRQE